DGIRDLTVTGVQTCDLPISELAEGARGLADAAANRSQPPARDRARPAALVLRVARVREGLLRLPREEMAAAQEEPGGLPGRHRRSEERRVGKECRRRGQKSE